MKKSYCVYIHYKKSDGKPFYIGKGLSKRPHWFHGRSEHWNRTRNKHGVKVFIAAYDLSEVDAFSLEKALISRAGLQNLCNHTEGGEGCSNPSQETRRKMSLAKIGHKKTREAIAKHAAKMRGRKMPRHAIEKTRAAHLGSKRSEAARRRMSDSHGDNKIYIFEHKDGRRFSGKRREMARVHGLSHSETCGLAKGTRQTAKGWRRV